MEQPVFLLSFSWVTWLTCLHDQIDHVYSRALQTVPLCSNFILCNHYRVRDKYPPAHTHTHTRSETQALLPMHLAGVDNHKDLLNGGDRSSLYQVYLYRPGDKWGRHNGWGRGAEGPYNAPDRIETTEWALVLNRAGLPPCLMNPPKLQEGRQMGECLLLITLNWKGENVTEKVRRTLPATEDGASCQVIFKFI